KDFVIVHTDYCQLVRHGNPKVTASVQNLLSPGVIAGHDPDRPGQCSKPARQVLFVGQSLLVDLFRVTAPAARRRKIGGTRVPRCLDRLAENPQALGRIRKSGKTAVSKAAKSAL